jgi:hypothetical protein
MGANKTLKHNILSPYRQVLDTTKEQLFVRHDIYSKYVGLVWHSKASLQYYYKLSTDDSYIQAKDKLSKISAFKALDKLLINSNYTLIDSEAEYNKVKISL